MRFESEPEVCGRNRDKPVPLVEGAPQLICTE